MTMVQRPAASLQEPMRTLPAALLASSRTVPVAAAGVSRTVSVTDWPKNAFAVASPPGSDRDFVLFSGIEPHLRWHSFLAAFEEVLRGVGCTTSVTLAAQPFSGARIRQLATAGGLKLEADCIFYARSEHGDCRSAHTREPTSLSV